ncbi:hypothetical protein [Devosia sp. Root413D1]|uniref:hypothetical protein n=1 Tax=Devosia sp. Root413D1 TaxID=1736531 RepID=UPI0012E3709F|nr:hypothetical protein [Devosia sp. Root413D1]
MIYVVRYCGEGDASTTAALRQAIEVLDRYLVSIDEPVGRELIVIYRNRLPGAVTLEVGYPVDQSVAEQATGEIAARPAPSGPMVATTTGLGFASVLAAERRLTGPLVKANRNRTFTWQGFKGSDFRPWRGHPSSPLFAPLRRDTALVASQSAKQPLEPAMVVLTSTIEAPSIQTQ